jgi:hypothetical protein
MSQVSIVTGLLYEQPGLDSRKRKVFFSSPSRPC